MSTHLTDILKYQPELKEAGVSDAQAEIHARKLAELIDGKLVTREYLNNRLKVLENSILLRMGGMLIAAISILFMLLKYHS